MFKAKPPVLDSVRDTDPYTNRSMTAPNSSLPGYARCVSSRAATTGGSGGPNFPPHVALQMNGMNGSIPRSISGLPSPEVIPKKVEAGV